MTPEYKLLAEKLRKARLERGLTQIGLADLLRVTQGTVSMFERAYASLKTEMADRICENLGVAKDDLKSARVSMGVRV